jgi:2,4-dienoyl-CoA reductase-like NADH-dependent reductase (Old Yellow Enzyme family)
MKYRRVASLKTAESFRAHLVSLEADLPFDEDLETGPAAPLAQPYRLKNGFIIGNRFAVLPMEGWDGTKQGRPTELTTRRWERFGLSGAKLIWGGEATAVRHEGRANPNQLLISRDTVSDLATLREVLVRSHEAQVGDSSDLLVGLQLTHSGRFSRPNDKTRLEPKILYHHPLLDPKFGLASGTPLLSDGEIKQVVDDFVQAARLARQALSRLFGTRILERRGSGGCLRGMF